jgi:hypothetical protein
MNRSNTRFAARCYILGLALSTTIAVRSHAIVGGCVPSVEEFRFDAVAAFNFADQNLTQHNHFANGTLVHCQWMLISRHQLAYDEFSEEETLLSTFVPPPSGLFSFRFRRKEDGTVGTVAQGPGSFLHIPVVEYILSPNPPGGGFAPDIALAKLATPVTHIDPIPIRYLDPVALQPGTPLLVAAWGRQGPYPTCPGSPSQKLKVALTAVAPFVSGLLWWELACAEENPCHCGPVTRDSGGGVLIESACGKVEIVGVIKDGSQGVLLDPFEGNPYFPDPILQPVLSG